MKIMLANVGCNDFTYWEPFICMLFLSFQMLFVEEECGLLAKIYIMSSAPFYKQITHTEQTYAAGCG